MKGLLVMSGLLAVALPIAWAIMETEPLLGYTVGVFGVMVSVAIGLDILTREKK